MRILASHICPVSGHTYAVIANPVADTALPTVRFRLIRALSPTWVDEVNTTRSVSGTDGIAIYDSFDCLQAWLDHPDNLARVKQLLSKAHDYGTVLSSSTPSRSAP